MQKLLSVLGRQSTSVATVVALFIVIAFTSCNVPLADGEETTILIVRHADRQGEDDALTEEGFQRAQALGKLAKLLRVDAIYSTETNRTQKTAEPAATLLQVPVQAYTFNPNQPDASWFEKIIDKHAGETVLIVGHSNTLHGLVRGFGGEGDYPIQHDEYDRLFIVSVDGETASVAKLRFGAKATGDQAD